MTPVIGYALWQFWQLGIIDATATDKDRWRFIVYTGLALVMCFILF